MRKSILLALGVFLVSAAAAFAQEPLFSSQAIKDIHEAVRRDCPRAWSHAHKDGDPERFDYMIEVVRRVYPASGGTVGGNWQRGQVGRFSMDGVTFKARDGRYYFADTIAGAGGASPSIGFNVTGEAPEVGFVDPSELPGAHVACVPGGHKPPVVEPPVINPPTSQPIDLSAVLKALATLQGRVEVAIAIGEQARAAAVRGESHAGEAKNIAQNISDRLVELEARSQRVELMLKNPPEYKGRILGMGFTIRAEPRE